MSSQPSTARVASVRRRMAEENLPCLLVSDLVNIGWLTGFTGSNGFVVVTQDDILFATDSRYTEQASQQCAGFSLVKLETSTPEEITGVLAKMGEGTIGFEAETLTVKLRDQYREKLPLSISLVPTIGLVSGLRMIKDEHEIAAIQDAVDIADRAWNHIVPHIMPGAVERDVMLELEWFVRKTCRADIAFDIVVASGPRSALPHGRAAGRTLQVGDLVTLDFGAKLAQYNSDITRTVVLGQPTEEQRKVYGVVRDALYRSIDAIRPGAAGRSVDAVGRDFIGSAGYGNYFGHGLGHGLGRSVHDHPAFSKKSEMTVREGMVVTVEPGIYIPGWGGVRIEHDVVVTSDGARILDKSPTELLVL